MSSFQPAIFTFDHRQHLFLELTLQPDADLAVALAALREVGRKPGSGVQRVLALGPALVAAAGFPPLAPFALAGMPATQRDAWIWLQGSDPALLFDAGQQAWARLQSSFIVAQEVQGFYYHDMRDMTGFVDGIGNPQGEKARAAALVSEGVADGGSYVLTQLWQHNLKEFHALEVAEQEQVIGRTKADAIEFEGDQMPADSHVGRTDVARDGIPQSIWRRSVPWGRVLDHGLYFLAFSCERERFDYLLNQMLGTHDGVRDRLLDFSEPLTGSYWFAPPESWFFPTGES